MPREIRESSAGNPHWRAFFLAIREAKREMEARQRQRKEETINDPQAGAVHK